MKKKFPQIDMYRTGQNIRRVMQMKGMAVRDVQEYLGLAAPQSIYHWFAGRSLPTVDNLYALSGLFCVPMDALVRGSREDESRLCYRLDNHRLMMYYKKYLEFKMAG